MPAAEAAAAVLVAQASTYAASLTSVHCDRGIYCAFSCATAIGSYVADPRHCSPTFLAVRKKRKTFKTNQSCVGEFPLTFGEAVT